MPTTYRLPYILHEPSEETEDMYIAEIPALQGCRAWGETPEETLEILKSLAVIFIESHLEDGDPLPPEIAGVGELLVAV